MIDLYTFSTPNGRKASVMLEEVDLPYNLHVINITKGDQHTPAYLAINPNGKIPALVDPDGPHGPLALFESGAILIYLAEKTGKLFPVENRYPILQWLMFQVGGVGPMFGQLNHFALYAPEKIAYAIDRYTKEVHRLYGVLNEQLGKSAYLAGADYTIADVSTYTWVSVHDHQGISLDPYPHVKRWAETIASRPAVQRGMQIP
ncbi:glutathione S-transferase family protein [Candidatus Cyanaurora vandensis]|uniref:glutathione S-transferase family protein n=1 Tax=Candidatus Cyanaurora vandensis TaxID=2714958 RepID=UPI00257F7290|nr:glutathione S-transferase N-terminal domain-containing protein [Candidatus Cyanaurora vandensis]